MFRYDIQGLRGLAIIFVIIYHYNEKWLKNGYIGVDIFLIISGYCTITSLKPLHSRISFICKRIVRLITPSYIVLLFLLLFINYIKYYNKLDIIKDIRYSIFQFINIKFYKNSVDYYSKDYTSLLLHYWSLSVEWQYIAFNIICFNFNMTLNIFLLCISLFLSLYFSVYDRSFNYFSILCRLWEFKIGEICNFQHKENINNLYLYLFILIAISVFEISRYIVLIILVYIVMNILCVSNMKSVFSNYILTFLGNLSYELYLTHYIVMKLSNELKIIKIIIISLILHFLVGIFKINYTDKIIIITIYIIATYTLLYICDIKRKHITKYMHKIIELHNFAAKDWFFLDTLYRRKSCNFDVNHINKSDILLLGDSHLLAWFKIIISLNLSNHPLIMLNFYINRICNKKISILYPLLTKTYRIIFISHYLQRKICKAEFIQYINILVNYTQLICIIQDTPFFYNNPWSNISKCYETKLETIGRTIGLNKFPIIESQKIKYFDPTIYMCKNNSCYSFYKGYLIYIDSHHVIPYYTTTLKNNFIKSFNITTNNINNNLSSEVERYLCE